MYYAGVDMGWKEDAARRNDAVVVLDDSGACVDWATALPSGRIAGVTPAVERLQRWQVQGPLVVGIDGPLSPPQTGWNQRPVEHLLKRLGIGSLPTTSANKVHRRPIGLAAELGLPVAYGAFSGGSLSVEVYPRATLVIAQREQGWPYSRLKYKVKAGRERTLVQDNMIWLWEHLAPAALRETLDLPGIAAAGRGAGGTAVTYTQVIDLFDAAVAALTVWGHATGNGRVLGDEEGGAILVPWGPLMLSKLAALGNDPLALWREQVSKKPPR